MNQHTMVSGVKLTMKQGNLCMSDLGHAQYHLMMSQTIIDYFYTPCILLKVAHVGLKRFRSVRR